MMTSYILDALTSDLPTFPYTAEENEKFINLLQSCKGNALLGELYVTLSSRFFAEHASNPYVTTFVARLWEIVGKHNVVLSNPVRPHDSFRSSKPPLFHSLW